MEQEYYYDGEGDSLPLIVGSHDANAINLHNIENLDTLNDQLDIEEEGTQDPITFFQKVRQLLGAAGYDLPEITINDEESGEDVFLLSHDGVDICCYLYCAYARKEDGLYEVFAELVTEDEFDDIVDDDDVERT